MGKKLKLHKFDPSATNSDGRLKLLGYFICINGARGRGKTKVSLDLMSHMQEHIDIAIAVSETGAMTGILKGIIPESLQHSSITPDALDAIMDMQEADYMAGRCKNMLLFLDDMAFDSTLIKSNAFKRLAFNGRHRNITVIFTLQYCMELPPRIRSNIDLVITMNEMKHSNKKNLHEHYFGVVTYEEFELIMNMATKGFCCLVLDNRSRADKLEELLFWYEADLERCRTVRLCNQLYWDLDAHYLRGEDAVKTEPKKRPPPEASAHVGQRIDVVSIADSEGRTVVYQKTH
jgi:hypothetical protein